MRQRVNARRLQRRIEYYSLAPVPDGFGGSTVGETKIKDYWAEVRTTEPGSNLTDQAALGELDFTQVYKITVRSDVEFKDPKKYELRFGGLRLEVLNVENVDLRGTKNVITARAYQV